MKNKISIIYSWLVRLLTIWMPNHPILRRFRGFLYSLMMKEINTDLEISSSVIITSLTGLKFGKGVRIAHNVVIIGTDITIGKRVIIGPNTVLSGGNHQFNGLDFRSLPSKSQGSMIIEDGTWVGANCTILSGAKLPKYSILAAGAVLNKKMTEEKSIYGGVPAKKIGEVK